ncbi:hypothetical protein VHEMI02292 [[Torrubiella] hemipterigena]|uniref:ABC transporter n=1 Tax=[Torrubiella] hemipterigena TaxID=1531966 RepID=A0A0A1T7U0_9HYPO|nr:hypothetical protein VHEMI02292 [[Torrubiella] hemipterigena]
MATLHNRKAQQRSIHRRFPHRTDFPPLDGQLRAEAMMKYNDRIDYKSLDGVNNGLAWKLLRVTGREFLPSPLLMFLYTGLALVQPLIVGGVVSNLDNTGTFQTNAGYGLIGATVIAFFGLTFFRASSLYYHTRWLARVNAILVNAIYRKALSGQSSGLETGKAITLMSNDIENVNRVLGSSFNKIMLAPVQVGFTLWLLYRQIGVAVVSVVVAFTMCILLTYLGTLLVKDRQSNWMKRIENRVGKTANAISHAKNIRIAGLSQAVENSILKMRQQEVQSATKFRAVIFFIVMLSIFAGHMTPAFPFIFNRDVSISQIFTTVAYVTMVTSPLIVFLQWVPTFFAALASIQRIQSFLLTPDRHDFREVRSANRMQTKCSENGPVLEGTPSIQIIGGNFGWKEDKLTLRDINTDIPAGLTLLVGPIASGKTTFCRVLLGEVPFASGQVIFNADTKRIPYCDQTAFLTNSTIKENIVGFESVDEPRYQEALRAAALEPDLLVLPDGDLTNVGSNGISLSGGQKQRVSIARAIYQTSEVYVFDDVLSGLDSDTEQLVFDNVFGPSGILSKRGATIILCTHSVRHLPSAQHIIALTVEGEIIEQGTFNELTSASGYIHSLGVAEVASKETSVYGDGDSTKDSSTETELKKKKKKSLIEDETDLTRAKGDWSTTVHYLANIGYPLTILLVFGAAVTGTCLTMQNVILKWWVEDRSSQSPRHDSSFWLGIYGGTVGLGYTSFAVQMIMAVVVIPAVAGTNLHKKAIKKLTSIPLQFLVTTDMGIIINLFSQDIFLVDDELVENFTNLLVFGFLTLGGAALATLSSPYVAIFYPFILAGIYVLQRYYQPASRQVRLLYLESKSPLYSTYLDTIKGLATYRAFDWNSGAVQKTNILLNKTLQGFYFQQQCFMFFAYTLTAFTNLIAVIVVILATQLKTSAGYAGASMVGVINLTVNLQGATMSYVDMQSALTAVRRLKTFAQKSPSESQDGEDLVPDRRWPPKGQIQIRNLSASYDAESRLSATNTEEAMELTYALRDVSLDIQAAEKVAICGRSGSGKSSLVLVLLRLLNCIQSPNSEDVSLSIDGVDLQKVDRDTLRQRLTAVPQEPIFLPDGASFSQNLDPTGVATDEERQGALEAVTLWDTVKENGGLDSGLLPESLSQGQKQLFSLARAIVRRRARARLLKDDVGSSYMGASEKEATEKADAHPTAFKAQADGGVLILDEYSSSLDIKTDRLMQDIIKQEFGGYTILMVSHRLGLVMDFDRVVVLDTGRVVENGNPSELVKVDGGRFRELWLIGNAEEKSE